MHRLLSSIFATLVLCLAAQAAHAQAVRFEPTYALQVEKDNEAISRMMAEKIGLPPEGMAQVVFYRSRDPQGGQEIQVTADGVHSDGLAPGTYIAYAAAPGTHPYGMENLGLMLRAGETRYIRVESGDQGEPRLLKADAVKFRNTARRM